MLILLVIALLWATPGLAATYYVSTSGSDVSGDGSLGNAWRTIAKATATMAAGDTTYVRGGTYTEEMIAFTNSGTAGNPITLAAYPGETPVIDAGYTTSDSVRKAGIWINRKSYITIDGFEIKRTKGSGIHIGEDAPVTAGILVTNNHIHDVLVAGNTAAVYLGNSAAGVTVRNNVLHPETQTDTRGTCVELFTGGNDAVIENNECYNAIKGIYYKHGVLSGSGYEANHPIVRRNYIHDLGQGSGAAAQVDAIESATDNTEIYGNLIVDITGPSGGPANGIRIFEQSAGCDRLGSDYTVITHNTFVRVTGPAITLTKPDTTCTSNGAFFTTVRDNLVYKTSTTSSGGYAIWSYGSTAVGLHGTISDYNLVWSTDTSAVWRLYNTSYSSVAAWNAGTAADAGFGSTAADTHSIQAAPVFVGYSSGNYSLSPSSPGYRAASDGLDMGACIPAVGVGNSSVVCMVDQRRFNEWMLKR